MLQLTCLYIGFFILILVIAFIFRRYQRAIFWAAAICMLLGVLFSIGFGVVDVYDGNRPNLDAVALIVMVLIASAVLGITAEKLYAKQREKEKGAKSGKPVVSSGSAAQSTNGGESGVVLRAVLRSDLAEKVFARAIEAGFMEEQGAHYKWKEPKVLLAYMCGRIYCGDYPEYEKTGDLDIWKFGRLGFFPDTELSALFDMPDLGQSRSNRRDFSTPAKSREIDKFFE